MGLPLGVAVTDLFGCLRDDNIATIAACGGAVNARQVFQIGKSLRVAASVPGRVSGVY